MFIFFIFIFNFFYIISGNFNNHQAAIENYINNYKRPVTILEIGIDSGKYAFSLAKKYDCTSVLMLIGALPHSFNFSVEKDYKNLIILNPKFLNYENLQTLVRCEHFDIVIIRDMPHNLRKNDSLQVQFEKTLELLIQLGDATFIELPKNNSFEKLIYCKKGNLISNETNTKLFFINIPKPGLDIARWSVKHQPTLTKPRYLIKSTFEHKFYYKDGDGKPIPWIKGINLLTCVMLRMICPCDETIRKNLESFRNLKHNDLILGNMVQQGITTIPIDVNDPRWDADVNVCLNAALRVFKGDNYRFKDPEKCYQEYKILLSVE